jgi:hypothetical protein
VKVSAQGDVMASFSSRGGPGQSLGVSKPDITAPGVQILAGASPEHVDVAGGPQGELFQAIAGTSMSSPHIAGAGALIKALHPNWTPGKIKSALMTTAWTQVVKEDGVTPATPFDTGSGRVDLNKAGSVGLTFDESAADYAALQDHLWDANYPSVYVPIMPGVVSVKRTAHSELRYFSCWKTSVDSPADVSVFVPPVICVWPGGDQTFSIVVDGHQVPLGETRHATLKLKFGWQQIHLPISFVRQQPVVTLDKTCTPATFPKWSQTVCSITVVNTSFSTATVSLVDFVPSPLKVVDVQGANAHGNFVYFRGALAGAEPPDVLVGTGSSPAGYLPLSLFGVAPISGMGDETIANFNVPAFQYAGETYTRLGVTSNGYVVVGGGTGADVQFVNQSLPNATRPNNVLAPFWTDLNPGAGGAVRIATLTDGVDTWIVVDFDNVPNYTGGANAFEAWIRIGTVEDITFTYGPTLTTGDGGFLTIGAENKFGNRGANFYYNGTGTFPGANFDAVAISSTPPAPGETHVVTVTAKGWHPGKWKNCAKLDGDIFFGTNVMCFSGEVTR